MESRRNFLKTGVAGVFVGLAGCINPPAEDSPDENGTDENRTDEGTNNNTTVTFADVTATLGANGFTAWLIESQSGGRVGEEGVNNPTLQFEEGLRYRFNNPVRSAHPLAFRNANNEDLLTQQGTGKFESDQSVEWEDEGDYVAFTVTSDLATELDEYYCTVHAQMVGDVQV